MCFAYAQGVRQGETGLWVDTALVPVAGARVCQNGRASCLEPGSISHPSPHTAVMESPARAQSFLAWSPSSGQAAGVPQLPRQESTLEVEGGDPGSCCPTVTPRVQSVGQRDFMEETVSAGQED